MLVAGLSVLLLVSACGRDRPALRFADLPPGDPERGAALFTQSTGDMPACASCHTLNGARGRGPSLADYADVAGSRVAGQDAASYTLESIIAPSNFIVSGYSNIMYREYADRFSPQEIADLIAFLLAPPSS
ncbi:MAG: hypothetical protein Kow0077_20350 [Anaerolineae bacterium]